MPMPQPRDAITGRFVPPGQQQTAPGDQAPVDQPPAEDPNALPPDPSAPRTIHGMNAEDILTAIESGNIPEQLYEALSISVDEDGKPISRTLKEARMERMRASDYGKKTRELRARETQLTEENEGIKLAANRERQGFSNIMQTLASEIAFDDPRGSQMYAMAEELGLNVGALAYQHALVLESLKGLTPEMRDQVQAGRRAQRQLERTNRAAAAREAAQREAEQAATNRKNATSLEAMQQRASQFVEQTAPAIFERHGLPITKENAQLVTTALRDVFRADPSSELTAIDIEEAVIAAKERIERVSRAQPPVPAAKPGALPPRPSAAPAPAQAQTGVRAPGGQQRARLSDFDSLLGLNPLAR